jgi:translation initiation factor 4G
LAPRKKTVALLQDPTTLEVVDLGKDTKTEGSLTSDKSSKPPSSSSSTPATGVTIPTFNASKPSEVPTEVETATPASETKTIPSAAVNFMKEVAQRASADDTQTSRSDSGDKIEKSELSVEGEKEPKGGNKPIDVLPADSSIASSDDKMTSSSSIEKDLKTVTAVTTDSSPRNIVPEEVRKAEEVSQKPTTSIPVVVVPPKQQSTPPAITAQVTDAKQQTPATTVASKDPSTLNNNNNKSSGKDSSKFNGDVSSPISSSNVKIVPPVKQTHTESGKTEKQDNKVSAAVKTAENNRLVYNRDELFRIKDLSTSKVKPSELTDDIINRMKGNLVMGSKSMSAAAADAFLPNFAGMRGLPGMTGASGASRSIRQSGNQPYSGRASQDMRNQPRKIIPSPSLSQDVKLHTTENAWKPEVGAKKPVSSEEETEEIVTKELLKRFRGYLNKITPQKYDVIEGKIRELEINTEDRLKRVLDLVFDKAVDEPAFCIQYATLCRYLGTVKVTKKNDNGEDVVVEFRRLLITRCQQEFEKNVYEGIDIEGRKAAIASCEDTDKKKVLEAELDEDKRRARKKSLGNMKLVGELYRLNMLKGFIMLNCVHKLCSEVEDETLECLCILLKTIGQKLETEMQANAAKKQTTNPTAAADLEQYFKRMRTIVADKSSSVSARVRFLLQDIIDMRDNNWQERAIHKDNKPKTIDQIHEDVKQEDKQNYEDHLRHQSQMKNDRGKPGQYNSRRSQQGSMQSRGNQAQETKNIISILQAQKAVGTSDSPAETTLAPKSFGTWAAGAKSAAPTLPAVASRPSQEGQRNSMGGRDAGRGQSYTGGMSRSQGPSSYSVRPDAQRTYIHSQPPKSNTPPFANQRQDLNRSRNASLDKTGKGSAPSSRSSSQRIESPRSQGSSGGRSPAAVMAADISEEEASKQVKLVIERLVRKDGMGLDTLEKEVEKYFNESTIGMFFSNAINQALESSPSTRTSLGEAFSHLICKSSLGLTPDIFFKA